MSLLVMCNEVYEQCFLDYNEKYRPNHIWPKSIVSIIQCALNTSAQLFKLTTGLCTLRIHGLWTPPHSSDSLNFYNSVHIDIYM